LLNLEDGGRGPVEVGVGGGTPFVAADPPVDAVMTVAVAALGAPKKDMMLELAFAFLGSEPPMLRLPALRLRAAVMVSWRRGARVRTTRAARTDREGEARVAAVVVAIVLVFAPMALLDRMNSLVVQESGKEDRKPRAAGSLVRHLRAKRIDGCRPRAYHGARWGSEQFSRAMEKKIKRKKKRKRSRQQP